MNVIIFDNGSGGVGIITPSPKYLASLMGANQITEMGAIALIALKDAPNNAVYEIIDDSTLPWDKPRELWRWE